MGGRGGKGVGNGGWRGADYVQRRWSVKDQAVHSRGSAGGRRFGRGAMGFVLVLLNIIVGKKIPLFSK